MTDHRNVVRQNYFRDIGDVMLVRNLFRLIRVINRTNSRPIWTPTCEDIDHNAKITSLTLPKKKIPIYSINFSFLIYMQMGIFVFRRSIWASFCNMVNIFTCRCPNRSGVGAIDSPDLFEQVLDQRCIPEVSEKIFTHDISMIRRQKMVIFGVLKVFISNFTYYNLY